MENYKPSKQFLIYVIWKSNIYSSRVFRLFFKIKIVGSSFYIGQCLHVEKSIS